MTAFFVYGYRMNKKAKKQDAEYLAPSAAQVGIRNCCPRCSEGKLFEGLLTPGKACMNCSLDYSFIDSGDGPAVFVILIIGFVVTAMAVALQSAMAPPLWVHMILWIPVILALSMWGLRFSKGVMIALQYQTKAKEGELGGEN